MTKTATAESQRPSKGSRKLLGAVSCSPWCDRYDWLGPKSFELGAIIGFVNPSGEVAAEQLAELSNLGLELLLQPLPQFRPHWWPKPDDGVGVEQAERDSGTQPLRQEASDSAQIAWPLREDFMYTFVAYLSVVVHVWK